MGHRWAEEIHGRFISSDGIDNLSQYKYSGEDHSLIYNHFILPFAKWLCNFTPMFVSANMMTLAGLLCSGAAYALTAWEAPTLTEDVHRWVCFVAALLIFIYIMLDAMDGTQARKTGMASPIGELFDHLCDSLSLTLCALSFCASIRSGPTLAFILLLSCIVPFYSSHWNDYNTGSLIMGRFGGPTDVLMMLVGALIFTGSVDSSFWIRQYTIFHHQFGFNETFVGIVSVGATISFIKYAYEIFAKPERSPQRPNGVKVILQLFAFATFLAISISWRVFYPHTLLEHPHQFLLSLGLIHAYLVGRLIVQRVVKERVTYFHFFSFVLLLAFFASKYGDHLHHHPHSPMDMWVVWGLLVFAFTQWLALFSSVVIQLSHALRIPVFIVPEEKRHKPASKRAPLLVEDKGRQKRSEGEAVM